MRWMGLGKFWSGSIKGLKPGHEGIDLDHQHWRDALVRPSPQFDVESDEESLASNLSK